MSKNTTFLLLILLIVGGANLIGLGLEAWFGWDANRTTSTIYAGIIGGMLINVLPNDEKRA